MKKRLFPNIFIIICLCGLACGAKAEEFCEPLPPPAGNVTLVDPSQTGNITSIVAGANEGATPYFPRRR